MHIGVTKNVLDLAASRISFSDCKVRQKRAFPPAATRSSISLARGTCLQVEIGLQVAIAFNVEEMQMKMKSEMKLELKLELPSAR